MGRVGISSKIHDCPEFEDVGLEALGAWVHMVTWTSQYRTCGLIPRVMVRLLGGVRIFDKLVSVNLLAIDADGYRLVGEGYWFRYYSREYWSKDAYGFVYERDGHRCRYCGARDDLTVDHIQPRCLGGGDNAANLVVAYRRCNMKKSGRTPEQAGMILRPVEAR